MPGQAFGIQPRLGKKKEEERSGNQLTDFLGDFPVDRIPIQFKGFVKIILDKSHQSCFIRWRTRRFYTSNNNIKPQV